MRLGGVLHGVARFAVSDGSRMRRWSVGESCLRVSVTSCGEQGNERANMRRHRSEGDSLSGGHRSQAWDVNMEPDAASFPVALLTDDVAVRLHSTGWRPQG